MECKGLTMRQFLSTPSARRATPDGHYQHRALRYFYPRPPRGGRRNKLTVASGYTLFLSTPSARRATPAAGNKHAAAKFLSTPSARRATCCGRFCRRSLPISIHALREEGDSTSADSYNRAHGISIHALREEGDRPVPAQPRRHPISIHALREEGDRKNRDKISIFL